MRWTPPPPSAQTYQAPSPRARRVFDRFAGAVTTYHAHQVVGLEHVPREGPVLFVFHHSFATYDAFVCGWRIYQETGRLMVGLGDNLLFRLPGVASVARRASLVPASPENGEALLRAGNAVGVAPGGMWEWLRPRTERRDLRWGERRGFVRLALVTRAPIVLVACPRADELFTVYDAPITRWAYEHLRVPAPVVRGLGPTLVPRPLTLTHYLSAPIYPDPVVDLDAQLEPLFERCRAGMTELLSR